MAFLLKIAYYALLAISSLVAAFYLFAGIFDSWNGANATRERVVLLIASAIGMSLLYWAFRVGHQQGHWGTGLAIVIGAIIAFFAIMLIGLLTGDIHWQ